VPRTLIGAKNEGLIIEDEFLRAESGVGFLGRGSKPIPHQLGVWGSVLSSAQTAQRFPPFSALRMVSPDSIILLIVDYHSTTGGKTPCPSPLSTPLLSS